VGQGPQYRSPLASQEKRFAAKLPLGLRNSDSAAIFFPKLSPPDVPKRFSTTYKSHVSTTPPSSHSVFYGLSNGGLGFFLGPTVAELSSLLNNIFKIFKFEANFFSFFFIVYFLPDIYAQIFRVTIENEKNYDKTLTSSEGFVSSSEPLP